MNANMKSRRGRSDFAIPIRILNECKIVKSLIEKQKGPTCLYSRHLVQWGAMTSRALQRIGRYMSTCLPEEPQGLRRDNHVWSCRVESGDYSPRGGNRARTVVVFVVVQEVGMAIAQFLAHSTHLQQ